ncbi:MAG: hypothetical protein KC420_17830 [Myxococcales bacterium]|nr:hypothetical protein [Myxococcales bacterium]
MGAARGRSHRGAPLRASLSLALALALTIASGCGDDGQASAPSTGATEAESDASGGATETGASATSGASQGSATEGSTTDTSTTGGELDLLEELRMIEGMEADELDPPAPGVRLFALTYRQPADHDDPGGLTFDQRLTLRHVDRDAPMVLSTSGYGLSNRQSVAEPTALFGANQINVEQRFFGPSRPEPADWTLLTIEEAASDHHRIVEALKTIYGGRWLATGASKGGMTSVYHRRFYPDDVDATLAYVAPHNLAELDPRYGPYIDAIPGPAACQDALRGVQAAILGDARDEVTKMVLQIVEAGDATFDVLGVDRVVEFGAIELRFVFWQYGGEGDCPEVPGPGASAQELFAFVDAIIDWTFFGDEVIDYFTPYYYQAATELGAPDMPEEHLGGLRQFPDEDVPALYLDPDLPVSFDASAMAGVSSWLDGAGERVLFIYGGRDPWTAAAFDPGGAIDTHLYVVPEGNHGSKIVDLPAADQAEAMAILGAWLEVDADVEEGVARVRARALDEDPPVRRPLP